MFRIIRLAFGLFYCKFCWRFTLLPRNRQQQAAQPLGKFTLMAPKFSPKRKSSL